MSMKTIENNEDVVLMRLAKLDKIVFDLMKRVAELERKALPDFGISNQQQIPQRNKDGNIKR